MKAISTFLALFLTHILFSQTWLPLGDFDGGARGGAVSFVVNDAAYIGLGRGAFYFFDFWKYNEGADSWTPVEGWPGFGRHKAVAFVIGDRAYVGLGEGLTPNGLTYYKDFYRYNPEFDSWAQIADFGGLPRSGAKAFVIDGYAYVGAGDDGSSYYKDFWRYDPVANTWTPVADLNDEARTGSSTFSFDGKGYLVSGGGVSTPAFSDLHEYNPVTNTWTELIGNLIPELSFLRATAFVLNGKAYIAYGGSNRVTEYDPVSGEITSWSNPLGVSSIWWDAVSFVLGNTAYFGTGCQGLQGQLCVERAGLWSFTTPVSVDEVSAGQVFSVFPSPVTGQFSIRIGTPGFGKFNLEIFNTAGKTMKQWEIADDGQTFDISALPAGVYYLRMTGNKTVWTEKIIKI